MNFLIQDWFRDISIPLHILFVAFEMYVYFQKRKVTKLNHNTIMMLVHRSRHNLKLQILYTSQNLVALCSDEGK